MRCVVGKRNVVGGLAVVATTEWEVVVGNQVMIEVDAVRALAAACRHDLTDVAPVGQLTRSVAEGGILLRQHAATTALGTAAARLRERLDTLQTLVGQLVEAVDASATDLDTTDSANRQQLDQISNPETGVTESRTPSPFDDVLGNSDGQ